MTVAPVKCLIDMLTTSGRRFAGRHPERPTPPHVAAITARATSGRTTDSVYRETEKRDGGIHHLIEMMIAPVSALVLFRWFRRGETGGRSAPLRRRPFAGSRGPAARPRQVMGAGV